MKNIILLLIEDEIKTYHQSQDERRTIHSILWEEDTECDALGEVLMLAADLNGTLSCIKNNNYNNIKSKIDFLKSSSIYNNRCIIEWINKYAEQFPKYWNHIKTVENLRIVGLHYLENIEYSRVEIGS